MYELVVLFRNVVSSVSALPVLSNPVPSRLLNDCPFTTKFVVLAVVNDPYVVDEYENVCNCDQVFAVVVPKARDRVLSDVRSPPPSNGYVVLINLELGAGVNPKSDDEAVMFRVPLPFDV